MISIKYQKSQNESIFNAGNDLEKIHEKTVIKARPNSYTDKVKSNSKNISNEIINNSCINERPVTSAKIKQKYKADEQKISPKKLQQVQEWLNEQIIKKNETQNVDCVDKKYISLHHQFNNTLMDKYEIIKDIDTKLIENEKASLRKKEIIYKNWRINTHEPLKCEINKLIDCPILLDFKITRDLNYLSYLKHINKHGCAFQNDFDPEYYNPLNRKTMSAKMKERSFLNINQRKTIEEEEIINSIKINSKNIKKSLPNIINELQSRSDINWNNWLSQKFNAVDSKIRIKSSRKCNPLRNNSKIDFNWHYGNGTYEENKIDKK